MSAGIIDRATGLPPTEGVASTLARTRRTRRSGEPETEETPKQEREQEQQVHLSPDIDMSEHYRKKYGAGSGKAGVRGVGRQQIGDTPFNILHSKLDFAGMSVSMWDTLHELFERQFDVTMSPDQIAALRAQMPEHALPDFDRDVAQIELERYDDTQAKIRIAVQSAFATVMQAASGTTTGLPPVAGLSAMSGGMQEIQRRLDEDKQLQHAVDIQNAELAQKFNESFVDWAKNYNETLTEREKMFNKFLVEKMKADIAQYESILTAARIMYETSMKATVDDERRIQTALTEQDKAEAVRKAKQAELNFRSDEANARFINAAEIANMKATIQIRQLEQADLVTTTDIWQSSSAYLRAAGGDPSVILPIPQKFPAEVLTNVNQGAALQAKQITDFYKDNIENLGRFKSDEDRNRIMRQFEALTLLASNGYSFNVEQLKLPGPDGRSVLDRMGDKEFAVPIIGALGAALGPDGSKAVLAAVEDDTMALRGSTLDAQLAQHRLGAVLKFYEANKPNMTDEQIAQVEQGIAKAFMKNEVYQSSEWQSRTREMNNAHNQSVKAIVANFLSDRGKSILDEGSK